MPKRETLELCRQYLFENPTIELSTQMKNRLTRIRSAYTLWMEFPMKSELQIRNFLVDNFDVKKVQSYDDIVIIKALLGNVKNASKDWHRFRFNAMIEESYEIAKAQQDPKALSMIIREYGKNNQLHIPDSLAIPWSEIIPQYIEPTEDPTVIGLKRDPNLRVKISDLMKKYSSDIAEDVTAVFIEDEKVNDE